MKTHTQFASFELKELYQQRATMIRSYRESAVEAGGVREVVEMSQEAQPSSAQTSTSDESPDVINTTVQTPPKTDDARLTEPDQEQLPVEIATADQAQLDVQEDCAVTTEATGLAEVDPPLAAESTPVESLVKFPETQTATKIGEPTKVLSGHDQRQEEWKKLSLLVQPQLQQAMTDRFKWNPDRFAFALQALDSVDRKRLQYLRRVTILKKEKDDEKAPEKALKQGEFYFVIEYLPGPARPQREDRSKTGGKRRPSDKRVNRPRAFGQRSDKGPYRPRAEGQGVSSPEPNASGQLTTNQAPGEQHPRKPRRGGPRQAGRPFKRGPVVIKKQDLNSNEVPPRPAMPATVASKVSQEHEASKEPDTSNN